MTSDSSWLGNKYLFAAALKVLLQHSKSPAALINTPLIGSLLEVCTFCLGRTTASPIGASGGTCTAPSIGLYKVKWWWGLTGWKIGAKKFAGHKAFVTKTSFCLLPGQKDFATKQVSVAWLWRRKIWIWIQNPNQMTRCPQPGNLQTLQSEF